MLVPSVILYEDRVIVAISFLIKAFNFKFLLSAIRSAGSVKMLFFFYKFLFKYFGKQLNSFEQNRLSEFQDNKCVLYKFTKVFFNQ